jgi:hypothetical protein
MRFIMLILSSSRLPKATGITATLVSSFFGESLVAIFLFFLGTGSPKDLFLFDRTRALDVVAALLVTVVSTLSYVLKVSGAVTRVSHATVVGVRGVLGVPGVRGGLGVKNVRMMPAPYSGGVKGVLDVLGVLGVMGVMGVAFVSSSYFCSSLHLRNEGKALIGECTECVECVEFVDKLDEVGANRAEVEGEEREDCMIGRLLALGVTDTP